jgi:hypothetical protein
LKSRDDKIAGICKKVRYSLTKEATNITITPIRVIAEKWPKAISDG